MPPEGFKETEIGFIPEYWEIKGFKECIDLIIDHRGKTPTKLGGSWSDSGFRALSAKNIKNGNIIKEEDVKFVNPDLYQKWMKNEIKKGDILMTSEAPLGECFLWDSNEKIVLSQRLFGIRANKNIIYPKYLFYLFNTKFFQHEIHSRATGTTVQGIRQAQLIKTRIIVPNLDEQKFIGNILYSLDEKIHLNRQMNRTLEAIGQAIFQHWFVYYEFPNENDQPYKSSGGEMADSELGEVPVGWNVGKVENIMELVYGKGLTKNKRKKGDIPVYGSSGVTDYHNKPLVEGPGIIIGRKGTVGTIYISHRDFWPIDTTYYVKSKNPKVIFSWYYLLKKLNLEKMNVHSAVPGLNRNDVYELPVCIPDDAQLLKYEEFVTTLFKKIYQNQIGNVTLTLIRDSLLPKLMSGKIRVAKEAAGK